MEMWVGLLLLAAMSRRDKLVEWLDEGRAAGGGKSACVMVFAVEEAREGGLGQWEVLERIVIVSVWLRVMFERDDGAVV